MKYLALLLLLLPLGCDTTGAALAPQETRSASRVSALSITYSRIDQRLMPVNIPTEVLDLVFSRLFGESICRSGGYVLSPSRTADTRKHTYKGARSALSAALW